MDFTAKIDKKTFKNDNNESIEYFDIKIIVKGQEIKVVPVESDKKLLKYLLAK